MGLGGKASATARGNKLSDLIMTGKSYASVLIHLRNRGNEAYKPVRSFMKTQRERQRDRETERDGETEREREREAETERGLNSPYYIHTYFVFLSWSFSLSSFYSLLRDPTQGNLR